MFGAREARESGDDALAAMYEVQAADEVFHVRFANDWIRAAVARDRRTVLDIARALTLGAGAFEWVFAGGGTDVTKYPVAEDERSRAGFNAAEVQAAAELSRQRRERVPQQR